MCVASIVVPPSSLLVFYNNSSRQSFNSEEDKQDIELVSRLRSVYSQWYAVLISMGL